VNLLKTLDLRLSFVYNKESGIFATVYFFVAHTHAKAVFMRQTKEKKKLIFTGIFARSFHMGSNGLVSPRAKQAFCGKITR